MTNAHSFSFTSIDGKPMALSGFAGKAILVVNTASACGLTPQYRGLEALWREYKGRGLVVLGVPCNDFGAQEPGTEGEIKTFCETSFGVDFPMTSKEHVLGTAAHPFYQWAAKELGEGGTPRWNFHKYLVAKDGTLAGTFGSRIEPEAADVKAAIEAALKG
jgi:glutathione peroxidase